MVKFEARDPFPLLESWSKSEALAHADEADRWLGLRVQEIERALALQGSARPAPSSSGAHQNLWFGLEPRDLQTPYIEIRKLLARLGRFDSVVDLGAAYARMGFVIERHFSHATFTGFEYVGERVSEARRAFEKFGSKRATVEHVDLTAPGFRLPQADVYFLYDYGTPAAIEKTLHDIRRASAGRAVTVVARGRVSRYTIESRHAHWLTKPSGPESSVSIYASVDRSSLDRIESAVEHGI